jgi:DNA topoisomerase-2
MDQGKKLEDIYQKKSQKEHILLRPDTYIGSVEIEEVDMWICEQDGKIIKK